MAKKRERVREDQLRNWNLLDQFRQRVLPLLRGKAATPTEQDERRTLFAEDYFCSYLFAMLNPVITSLRSLCHVSHCQKMREVSAAPFSPAAFSAGQHVFEPQILEKVVRQLAQENQGRGQGGDARVRQALAALTAVDGTVLCAVPRMAWAPAGGPGTAIKLHLHFNVFDQIPEAWPITPGNVSEPKVFAQTMQPGALIVADRNYGHDFALLAQLRAQGIQFVLRLFNNLILEPAGPDRPLTEADRRAGVVWDRLVRFGVHGDGPVFRVVRVEAHGDVFHLVTTRDDLSAELIGLIYRQRWRIELFFKWIKTILNCRHWLAESPAGVQMQIYCVLIASLLLMLWTGQRPNKRMVESLQWHWTGLATEEDLVTLLERAGCKKKS
ncbi:MAG TPA: IS4 family transposase [Verrucomicrobiae bacterium]